VPALQIRKHYLLSEAFELVGRRLFGRTWTGTEYAQRPTPSPDEIAATREPYETSLTNLSRDLTEIESQIARSLDQAVLAQAAERKQRIEEQLTLLRTTLHLELSEPNEAMRDQWETYQRRVAAERTLKDAIREHRFGVDDGRGNQIHPLVWTDDPRFRCYVELSIAVTAKRSGTPRVQPVRIEEHSFDSWLRTLGPLVAHEPPKDELPPVEKARALIRKWVAESDGVQLKSKAAYMADAQERIKGLSERGFDQAWAIEAPPSWKKHGKRKWPVSPQEEAS
jgi:hypothetical protein